MIRRVYLAPFSFWSFFFAFDFAFSGSEVFEFKFVNGSIDFQSPNGACAINLFSIHFRRRLCWSAITLARVPSFGQTDEAIKMTYVMASSIWLGNCSFHLITCVGRAFLLISRVISPFHTLVS